MKYKRYYNYKFKYLFRRIIKRLLRFIVLFGLLSSLTLTCFASSKYEISFLDMLRGGGADVYRIPMNSSSVQDWIKDNYVDGSSFTGEFSVGTNDSSMPTYSGVAVHIDSTFVNREVKSNDVFICDENIRVNVYPPSSGSFVSQENWGAQAFQYNLNVENSNGHFYQIQFGGTSYWSAKNIAVNSEYKTYDVNFHVSEYVFKEDLTIHSIDICFYRSTVLGGGAYYSRYDMDYNDNRILWYIGSQSDAPAYSSLDTGEFDDYEDIEQGLIDDTDASDEINDVFTNFTNTIDSLLNGFTVLRGCFAPVFSFVPFSNLLYVSLALGVVGLLLNLPFVSIRGNSASSVPKNPPKYDRSANGKGGN